MAGDKAVEAFSQADDLPSEKQPSQTEEENLWGPVDLEDSSKPWSEKTATERMKTILVVIFRMAVLLGLLYLFVCSIGLLSDSFRLLGGKAAGEAFRNSKILSNPLANLMMGVLATVLLQSSSTTTSIVVSMVSVKLVPVNAAIFIIMGANIGTSITNTIVSIGQVAQRDQFRRAFAGATVHDCFNWLTVLILLPVEWISSASWRRCYPSDTNENITECNKCGLLCQMTAGMVTNLGGDKKLEKTELLKVITNPFQKSIIQIDKKIITKIALGEQLSNASIMKHCTKDIVIPDSMNPISCNFTDTSYPSAENCWVNYITAEDPIKCGYLFESKAGVWSDTIIGIFLLFFALALLMGCLIAIVRLLHSLLQGSIAKIIQRFINADLPGCAKHLTGYIAILLGMGFTMLLQSSSIFTSAVTPLVGTGVLSLERMYPLTLGANIGTTFTAILAALAASDTQLSMQVALCHLFFNIFGILIWYPVPAMRKVPVAMAKMLGVKTAKHRWFAIVYLLVVFLGVPGAVFGLSLASWKVILGVGLPIFVFFLLIVLVNILQAKCVNCLPKKLQTWDFLPLFLHSLKAYDACCHRKDEEEDTGPDYASPDKKEIVGYDNLGASVESINEVDSGHQNPKGGSNGYVNGCSNGHVHNCENIHL